jgi:hypothetical protein
MIEFFKDYISYMKERKKWFLLPLVIVMLVLGILTVSSQSSVLSPFVYTLF